MKAIVREVPRRGALASIGAGLWKGVTFFVLFVVPLFCAFILGRALGIRSVMHELPENRGAPGVPEHEEIAPKDMKSPQAADDANGLAEKTKAEDKGKVGDVVAELIGKLKDKSAEARKAAADKLGELGAAAESAVPWLEMALNDTAEDVRRAASHALARIQKAIEKEDAP